MEWRQAAEFVRFVHDWLGQPRWLILSPENVPEAEPLEDENIWADTDYHQQRYTVILRLSPQFYELAEPLRYEVLIHEAVHSIHVPINQVFEGDLVRLLHVHEHMAIMERYTTQRELMVDLLARALMDVPAIRAAWDQIAGT